MSDCEELLPGPVPSATIAPSQAVVNIGSVVCQSMSIYIARTAFTTSSSGSPAARDCISTP